MNKKDFRAPFSQKDIKTRVAHKYWKLFIEDLLKRKNFNEGMLKNLQILCELYQDYEDVKTVLAKEGKFYEAEGRYGTQKKPHPLVAQKKQCVDQIIQFTKLLELQPSKEFASEKNGNDEWS